MTEGIWLLLKGLYMCRQSFYLWSQLNLSHAAWPQSCVRVWIAGDSGVGEGRTCYPKYVPLIRMLKIKEKSHETVFFFSSHHSKGHALLTEFQRERFFCLFILGSLRELGAEVYSVLFWTIQILHIYIRMIFWNFLNVHVDLLFYYYMAHDIWHLPSLRMQKESLKNYLKIYYPHGPLSWL